MKLRRASQPSPSPAQNCRLKSAATTPVSEPGVNVATAVGADCVDSALICRPVSDAPALSITRRFGSAVTKRRRTLGVSAAPPLLIETSPDRS